MHINSRGRGRYFHMKGSGKIVGDFELNENNLGVAQALFDL